MARIPAEEIERLKREVALERLAEVRGIRLQRHGARDQVIGDDPVDQYWIRRGFGCYDAYTGR